MKIKSYLVTAVGCAALLGASLTYACSASIPGSVVVTPISAITLISGLNHVLTGKNALTKDQENTIRERVSAQNRAIASTVAQLKKTNEALKPTEPRTVADLPPIKSLMEKSAMLNADLGFAQKQVFIGVKDEVLTSNQRTLVEADMQSCSK